MPSPKTIARLEAQILRRAAHCLQFELADPRAGFITLTGVELSQDLAYAKLKYSVLGDEGERSKAQHMLEKAGGFVQRQVASVLRVRTMPRLRWEFDESVAEAARMDTVIRAARERDERIAGESASQGDSQDSAGNAAAEPNPGGDPEQQED